MAFFSPEPTESVFSNYIPQAFIKNSPKSLFTTLPIELSIKILTSSFVADIFSFLCVSQNTYKAAQYALIDKARLLGYGKTPKLENYEDASRYIKQIFFRFTHEKVGCFFITKYRSSQKAIANEKKFLRPAHI